VRSAVFTRNPGGNARVVEMLVAAGADPDPLLEGGKRLSDFIQVTCDRNGCSTPLAKTIAAVEKLGKVTIER